ncbi:MAG: CoA transferase [Betaproteobacteria bacterium]|nr:MAG: CoA transferase [Betaproteobacteria bacterium]
MMNSNGALHGIKVVDLSRVLGGPFCTQILGDHGANVIKIEPPQGDETRGWGPPFADGVASYFLGLNRNKVGRVLDLSQPTGREELMTHLKDADVVVENFKTGTMEKWGMGFAVLHARFPRLIHCRISGFGADGPLGGLPGYDAAIQALCGIMSVNGEADRGPLRVGLPIVDMVCGMNAALGILMALQERTRSGLGQFVEASLYDSGLSLLHPHAANYFVDGRTPARTGNAHPNIYPYDAFATASEPIFLAVGNDRQFATLCNRIGAAQLPADPLYASNGARSVNRKTLKQKLEERLATFECRELADVLNAAGVPCAPIMSVSDALTHPHTAHRAMIAKIGDSYAGVASPIKLSRTPATYRFAPPRFKKE